MSNHYINAHILNVRVINEHTAIDEKLMASGLNLSMTDNTIVEVRLEKNPEQQNILVIAHHLDATFSSPEEEKIVVTYKSKHEVRFVITAHTDFDLESSMPQDACMPYIEMAAWIVRVKATNSVRNVGLGNFTWPIGKIKRVPDPKLEAPEKIKRPKRAIKPAVKA